MIYWVIMSAECYIILFMLYSVGCAIYLDFKWKQAYSNSTSWLNKLTLHSNVKGKALISLRCYLYCAIPAIDIHLSYWKNITRSQRRMGKSKKRQASRKSGDPVARSGPLAEQMLEDDSVRDFQRVKYRQHAEEDTVWLIMTTLYASVPL